MSLVFDKVSVLRGNFALHDISFTVPQGELATLIGPNGSGKSTLLKMTLGLIPASQGIISINGFDAWKRAKRGVNYCNFVPDDQNEIIKQMTPYEYWDMLIKLNGLKYGSISPAQQRNKYLREILAFDPPNSKISTFSHGMIKKTQMVGALQCVSEVVLLDEPSNGLDERSWENFTEACSSGLLAESSTLVAIHDQYWALAHSQVMCKIESGTVIAIANP